MKADKVIGIFGAGPVFLSVLIYLIVSLLVFGSLFSPIRYFVNLESLLGASHGRLVAGASVVVAVALVALLSLRLKIDRIRLPLIVGLWMGLSILSAGLYSEFLRRRVVNAFNPDVYLEHSFFRSLREAPKDFQFFLHAAALKDCKPYAWSYRAMAFYELPASTAVNVLPDEWLKRCKIERTSRF